MKNVINFLLCGVGGQGTVLASDVLVNVGLAAGLEAKQAEVHGMSQRGGSVISYVRWGREVHAPIIGQGEADILLAFEKLEVLRNIRFLRADGVAVINNQAIVPLTVTTGGQKYPADEEIRAAFAAVTPNVRFVDGERIAEELGNLRVANVVLLGALSALLEREPALEGSALSAETWLKVIEERVPAKYVELNRRAFEEGRRAVE
ncbi:MAG: indolepyruvate oxidoreductase subunit beta [Anaerolineales bacterium]|nr:indolepyruvate oxidoreductase subunit beta [Anaerolineales bacterium]